MLVNVLTNYPVCDRLKDNTIMVIIRDNLLIRVHTRNYNESWQNLSIFQTIDGLWK